MEIKLPWSIPRLTVAVPCAAALLFLSSSLLKLLGPHMPCFDPWAPANAAMGPLEVILAACLWSKRCRSFGALLGCGTMLGAGTVLTWAHYSGFDVSSCGCFGPIKMPYIVHMVLIGALLAACFAVLIADTICDIAPLPDPLRTSLVKPSAFFKARQRARA